MKNKKLMWGIIILLILITLFLIYWFGIREPKPPKTEPKEDPVKGNGGGGNGNGGGKPVDTAVFPLQVGMQGDSVKSVQNKLKSCFKFTSVSATGLLDDNTGYALGSVGYSLPMSKAQWNAFMASSNCR